MIRRPGRHGTTSTRRELLGRAGLAAAWLSLPRQPRRTARLGAPELEELVRFVMNGSSTEVFEGLVPRIRAGLRPADLLAATCVAGARDVRPRPHGILHCVMMVESSFRLAEGASPREAWLAALYNVDDFKRAQARDRDEDGDFRLVDRPVGERDAPASPDAWKAELVSALEEWDAERADRAAAALVRQVDHRTFFEMLWPFAARCRAFIGHKAIYAAQLERTLARIGWEHAEAPVRSLVACLLVERDTADFARSRELAPRIPAEWRAGAADPDATAELLIELRTASPRAAQALVVEALRANVAPASIWDALRLAASELFLRRPGRRSSTGRLALLPVHPVTVTEAFGHAWRTTASDGTKRLVLLQAAAWLAGMRTDLDGMVGLAEERPLPLLGTADVPATLDELLERSSPDAARSFLEEEPARAAAWTSALRRSLLATGREHHQHKYAAAVLVECEQAHARWRPLLLAPAADYLAHPEDTETELFRRSLRVLD